MQYIIHDLLQMPLEDRLSIIEKIICTMVPQDREQELKTFLSQLHEKGKA